jgi:hypothetical protein
MQKNPTTQLLEGLACDHTQIAPCCDPIDCGHYSCPCGLYWDDGASGPFMEDDPEFATLNGPYDFGPAESAA